VAKPFLALKLEGARSFPAFGKGRLPPAFAFRRYHSSLATNHRRSYSRFGTHPKDSRRFHGLVGRVAHTNVTVRRVGGAGGSY
jgi:hypothetical protein